MTFISNSVTYAAGHDECQQQFDCYRILQNRRRAERLHFITPSASPATVTEINNGNNFSNLTFTGATAFIGWRSGTELLPGSRKTVTTTPSTTSRPAGRNHQYFVCRIQRQYFCEQNVSGNTISNITGGGSISGIFSDGQNQNFSDNTMNTLISTGAAATVSAFSNGGATTQNIFRNKIYDIQANDAAGTVNGILISAGTTVNVYNNLIGDLRTPAANAANPLIGMNITGGTTVNAYYNTVFLNAASTGALFGSSAISANTLDINIA